MPEEIFAVLEATRGRPVARRAVAALASTFTALSLIAAPASSFAAPAPPPNPSDGQISAAQQAKNSLADRVGALSGQIAQAEIQLKALNGKAELAEQKYAFAYTELQRANEAALTAKAQVRAAQANVDSAHTKFVDYVQAAYMSGGIDGTGGSLLTANDPNALLEQSALEQYQQQHQADAVGVLQQATVAKSNADARARDAVNHRKAAAVVATQEKQAAFAAVSAAKQQRLALQSSLAANRRELDAAQLQLAQLNNQRAAYIAYRVEQARLARIRAERARQARLAAEAAAAAAARARQHHSSGGGGGGSYYSSGPSAPSGGGWTAAKGQRAANRALSQLGMSYAWAGGGVGGPSYGVCDASNGAPNDCNVDGFDCSGLVLYAWGQYWDHLASNQYSQAGSYHPSPGNLRPGDLLFWSDGGPVGAIHHVAIAIGGGQMVEAPYSGGFVQVESIYEYGNIDYTTRPLT